jgi:hypothetical protein
MNSVFVKGYDFSLNLDTHGSAHVVNENQEQWTQRFTNKTIRTLTKLQGMDWVLDTMPLIDSELNEPGGRSALLGFKNRSKVIQIRENVILHIVGTLNILATKHNIPATLSCFSSTHTNIIRWDIIPHGNVEWFNCQTFDWLIVTTYHNKAIL